MKIYTTIRDQKGATAVLVTLLILGTVLAAVVNANTRIVNEIKKNKEKHNSTIAFFAAESGAENLLIAIRKYGIDPFVMVGCDDTERVFCFDVNAWPLAIETPPCGAGTEEVTLANGSEYTATHHCVDDGSNATTTIKTLGTYMKGTDYEISRRIELVY